MFGVCLFASVSIIFVYLATETWVWHKNLRIEQLFWTAVATFLSGSLFWTHDGPAASLGQQRPFISSIICLAFVLFVRRVYRRISSTIYLTRFESLAVAADVDDGVQILSSVDNPHLAELETILKTLDYSSHAVRFIQRGNVVTSQRALQKLLASVPADALNSLVVHTNMPRLLESAQEISVDILRLLVGKRLGDLGVSAKATILDALQKIGIPREQRERFVRDIILSVRGPQLLRLKSILDGRGSWHNLFKLVYIDVQNKSVRGEILTHMSAESLRETAASKVEEGGGAQDEDEGASRSAPDLKVLSDIDDTLYCSGGPPAGLDKRFPKKTVYPGVLALYRELDTAAAHASPQKCMGCNLVFLSARPHSYKGFSESASYRRFRRMVAENTLHAMPTLLSGDAGSAAALMKNFAPIGKKKHSNFVRYARLYPEKSFVFFGDSGQGDVLAGELMLGTHPRSVLAVMIHDLGNVPDNAKQPPTKPPRVHYFKTYVAAATILFGLDILPASSLRTVVMAAIAEFHRIHFKSPALRDKCLGDLARDCEGFNALVAAGSIDGPPADATAAPPIVEEILSRTMNAARFLRRKSYSVLESTAHLFPDPVLATRIARASALDGMIPGADGGDVTGESDTDWEQPSTSATNPKSPRRRLQRESSVGSTTGDSACDDSDGALDSMDDADDAGGYTLDTIQELPDNSTATTTLSVPASPSARAEKTASKESIAHGDTETKVQSRPLGRKKHTRTVSDGSALLKRAVIGRVLSMDGDVESDGHGAGDGSLSAHRHAKGAHTSYALSN